MIATGALVTFVAVALARLSFGLILPPMRAALGLSYEQAGDLGTATALGYLGLVMVAGALAARRGGRLSILLGLCLATLGFAGLSLAANYWLVMGLLGIVFGPIWGILSDWLGRANSLMLAFVSTSIPVLAPTLAGFSAHYLILGVSVTGLFTSALAASTERVAVHEAPLAVSFVTVFFAGGQLLGPAAAGFLIGATDGFRMTFAISSSLLFVGMLLSLSLRRIRRVDPGRVDDAPVSPARGRC